MEVVATHPHMDVMATHLTHGDCGKPCPIWMLWQNIPYIYRLWQPISDMEVVATHPHRGCGNQSPTAGGNPSPTEVVATNPHSGFGNPSPTWRLWQSIHTAVLEIHPPHGGCDNPSPTWRLRQFIPTEVVATHPHRGCGNPSP